MDKLKFVLVGKCKKCGGDVLVLDASEVKCLNCGAKGYNLVGQDNYATIDRLLKEMGYVKISEIKRNFLKHIIGMELE